MSGVVRFRDLVAAEQIRLLSLRATYIIATAAITLAAAGAFLLSARHRLSPEGKAAFNPLFDESNTGVWGALTVAAACVGAAAVTGEYASGLTRTVFVAVPARSRVMAAKAVALASASGTVGAAATAATYAASRVALAGNGLDQAAGATPALLRDVAAALIALPASAVIGMAIGAVVRHPALAALTTVVLLVLVPSLMRTDARGLQASISNAMPYHAWCALVGQAADGPVPLQQPPSVAESWVWLAVWPCAALALATLVTRRRDL